MSRIPIVTTDQIDKIAKDIMSDKCERLNLAKHGKSRCHAKLSSHFVPLRHGNKCENINYPKQSGHDAMHDFHHNLCQKWHGNKYRNKIKITLNPVATVPMICGLNQGIIILPPLDYLDQELYVILEHEYIHFKNHDSYIKLIVEIISLCFWWNPFVYLMKLELNNILEIKCDSKLVENYEMKEILLYTEIMFKFLLINKARKPLFISSASAFCNEKVIKQRFELLLAPNSNRKKQKILSVFIAMILFCILVCSYSFIFQSHYIAEYKNKINDEKINIEQNVDGTYTVYSEEDAYIILEEHFEIMIANGFIIEK